MGSGTQEQYCGPVPGPSSSLALGPVFTPFPGGGEKWGGQGTSPPSLGASECISSRLSASVPHLMRTRREGGMFRALDTGGTDTHLQRERRGASPPWERAPHSHPAGLRSGGSCGQRSRSLQPQGARRPAQDRARGLRGFFSRRGAAWDCKALIKD